MMIQVGFSNFANPDIEEPAKCHRGQFVRNNRRVVAPVDFCIQKSKEEVIGICVFMKLLLLQE